MRALSLLSLIFLMALLLGQQAQAKRLVNLYTLSSQVADTSDEQRAVVANVLLRELLVRVSSLNATQSSKKNKKDNLSCLF